MDVKRGLYLRVFLFVVVFCSITVIFWGVGGMSDEVNGNIKMVSGTEYVSGEKGQIIVRLADDDEMGIINADCRLNVLYPDKRYLFMDMLMQVSSEAGNYYVEFIIPNTTGIYSELIKCSYKDGRKKRIKVITSSFHVSTALNLILEISQKQQEDFEVILNSITEERQLLTDQLTEHFLALINETNSRIHETETKIMESLTENRNAMKLMEEDYDSKIGSVKNETNNRIDGVEEKLNKFGDAIGGIFVASAEINTN